MKLIYLATPYTHYPSGLDAAFEDASAIAGALIKRGLAVFSPICHSHPIAKHGGIDAVDHELWMRIDREMWERCDELLVAKMPGWDQSRGIAAEIEYFLSHGKPVTYTEVGSWIGGAPEMGTNVPKEGTSEVAEERTYRIGGHPPRTAAEIAQADGCAEYGNPLTPNIVDQEGALRGLVEQGERMGDYDRPYPFDFTVTPSCGTGLGPKWAVTK